MSCKPSNIKKPLTQKRLKEFLNYDSKTGVFCWVKTKGAAKKGKVAGCKGDLGYLLIRLDGQLYLAHRLAWLYVNGKWPKDEIDHKNHIPSDNWINNLRDGTRSLNLENQIKAQRGSASGKLGAYQDKRNSMWSSKIQRRGVSYNLGRFKSCKLAHAAYLKAKRELHFFNML